MPNEVTGANASANANTPEKKIVRRGISNATRGTQCLTFTHTDAQPNGLFLARIDSVELTDIVIGEDKTGMPSFNGCSIPRLRIVFTSTDPDANKRKYVTLSFTAVESNAMTIPGGKEEWKINSVFDWLKHLLNVFVLKGREMTAEEEEALSLSFIDFDEQGDYVPVDVEQVIAGWRALFENFVNMMNTGKDGKPCYKTADGKDIALWIKLIRYNKTKKGWSPIANGDLAFPAFVGKGCVEIFKQNSAPSISIDAVRETIRIMNVEKPKAPTNLAGPAGAGVMVPGIPAADPMMGGADFDAANLAAGEDMPF